MMIIDNLNSIGVVVFGCSYAQPIPFEEDWSWAELLKATRIYIDMVSKCLCVLT